MTLMAFFRSILRLFYHLTVGLTVLLLQTGLLYLLFFLTLATWVTLVGVVTWKTYVASGHHLGWSVLACVLTAVLFGGLVVVAHRVARDWLGLTTLSLPELVRLVHLRRRPRSQARPGGGDGDSTQSSGRSEEAHGRRPGQQQVQFVRRVHNATGGGTATATSSMKVRTTTITGQAHGP